MVLWRTWDPKNRPHLCMLMNLAHRFLLLEILFLLQCIFFLDTTAPPPKKNDINQLPQKGIISKGQFILKSLIFSGLYFLCWKFNIALENRPSQKERIVFQPSFWQGQAVRLWGCITPWKIDGWNLQITGH